MSWGIAFAFFIGVTVGFVAAGFLIGAAKLNAKYDADSEPHGML